MRGEGWPGREGEGGGVVDQVAPLVVLLIRGGGGDVRAKDDIEYYC